MQGERGHRFGGDWTQKKLDVLAEYLSAYTRALKNQSFEKWYVDAFAGTGYRSASTRSTDDPRSQSELFPELAESDPQSLLEGSARRALAIEPPFSHYVFIEKNVDRYRALEGLKSEFPRLASGISIRRGDANQEIVSMCSEDWRSRRAVVFLDPYGLEVEWTTIEAIAKTQAIDLWLLFPLGIGVNRLLKKSGDIPDSWRRRLNLLLGTRDWYEEFYKTQPAPTLFNATEQQVVKARTDLIGTYFIERLSTVFAGVANSPGVLRNSKDSPLYLLCFAVGNPAGKDIALRIANHLLKELI